MYLFVLVFRLVKCVAQIVLYFQGLDVLLCLEPAIIMCA